MCPPHMVKVNFHGGGVERQSLFMNSGFSPVGCYVLGPGPVLKPMTHKLIIERELEADFFLR